MRLRPLFTALTLLVLGILGEPWLPGAVSLYFGLSVLSCVLGLIFLRRPALAAVAFLLPFFLLGVGRARQLRTPPPLAAALGTYRPCEGEVEGALFGGFVLRTAEGRLLVRCPQPETVRVGDRVQVRGTLRLPPTATNPGEYDLRAALARRGVLLELRTRIVVPIERTERQSPPVWLRRTIHNACFTHLPETEAALLAGLLVSDRGEIPAELVDAFQRTGTIHILSTSGLHLALLAVLVAGFLARLLPRAPDVAVGLSLVVIGVYALAAGGGGAVTRSAVMVAVFLIAPRVRREPEPLHSLALAALLILLGQPLALFEPGTQLSFATVAVLVAWWPTLEALAWPWERGLGLRSRALRWLVLGFLVGLVAQVGSAGLVAYHFHLVSWIAPLANLPIAALSELLLVLGMLAVALGGPLWWLCGKGVALLRALALGFGAVPFGAVSTVEPPALLLCLFYALLILPAPVVRLWLQRARFRVP